MVKKIETLKTTDEKSEVISTTKKELSDLNLSIWPDKDKEKFEKLSKDRALNRWLNKILAKWLSDRINIFNQNYNKYTHKKVEDFTFDRVKARPDLTTFICWELWLPINTKYVPIIEIGNTKSESDKWSFSLLPLEQKLKFMALYETKDYFWNNFAKVWASEIINRYHVYMKSFIDEATKNFNKNISDKKFLGFVNLKNILKDEYGLTDTEYEKMEEYLKLIQQHPEYVWWDMKPMQSWAKERIIIWLTLALLAAIGYIYIEKTFRLKEPETRIYGESTEIKNFKEVFKIMSLETELTSNTRVIEWDPLGYYDEETWCEVIRTIKKGSNIVRKIINDSGIESRRLELQVDTEIAHIFDFETAKWNVELKNWKWTIHVEVWEPELKIIDTDVQIFNSKRELINLDRFDDFDIQAVETLKQEALDKANTPEVLEKAIRSLGKNILTLYHINWIATSDFCIKGDDIETVIVECAGKKITVKLSDLEK